MKLAMGALAVLAIDRRRRCRSRGVNESLHHFLEPTFADSSFYEELEPSTALTDIGLLVGAGRSR